jgi:hypothetical protein
VLGLHQRVLGLGEAHSDGREGIVVKVEVLFAQHGDATDDLVDEVVERHLDLLNLAHVNDGLGGRHLVGLPPARKRVAGADDVGRALEQVGNQDRSRSAPDLPVELGTAQQHFEIVVL